MLTRVLIAAAVLLGVVDAVRAGELPIGSMAIPIKVSELAAAAGVHRVDAATLPLDIIRMAFASPDGASATETKIRLAVTRALDRDAEPADVLPLPLGSKTWTNRVLRRPIPDGRLAAAIFGSRSSALLYHGLMGIEPATLAWLESNPAALEILHRHAAVGSVYARSIRIKDNRVVTPGDKADEVWASIVGADPAKPAAFIDKLFSARSGRLAALYDTVAHLDAPRQAFAIGRAADRERIAKANRLLDAVTRHVPRWRRDEYPFLRSDVDGALLLQVVRVTPAGDLAPPAARSLWSQVFPAGSGDGTLDAASLAEMILAGGDKVARQRLELFLFSQRALGPDPNAEKTALLAALQGFQRYPALMLTLESHALATSAYAAATGAAAALDGDEEAVAVFQCGLAIIDRARRSGTVTAVQASVSIEMLIAAATARAARPALIDWMRTGFLELFQHAIPGDGPLDADALVLAALAGPRAQPGPTVLWENREFRVDLAGAELRRLTAIRRRQDEMSLGAALAAATPRNLGDLAHSLTAIVYAAALGDPGGQAALAGPVWRRHRFAGNEGGQPGQPIAWRLAREVFAPDGWRLAGSLLRLDAALAPLALRRLDETMMPVSSNLSTMDRRTLAVSVALIEPRGLADSDRDAIAAALGRGRARSARLAKDPSGLDDAADAAALSEWRRNAARWMLATTPERILESFSVLELFRLGGGDASATWGTTTSTIDGCLCLRFPPRNAWEEFAGRPSSGQLATQLPDVLLRTAEILAARRLPAVLARDVVAFAMQEVLDRARPVYFDDWLAIAFAARDLRDEQFDDYISTLTVAGPLIPAPKEPR